MYKTKYITHSLWHDVLDCQGKEELRTDTDRIVDRKLGSRKLENRKGTLLERTITTNGYTMYINLSLCERK